MDNRRDELINQITLSFCDVDETSYRLLVAPNIADFILQREQKLLDEVERPLKIADELKNQTINSHNKQAVKLFNAIDEALSTIARMKEE